MFKNSILWRVLENLFFAVALFLLIPPVPSMKGETYSFFPLGYIAIVLFSTSKFISLWRKSENIYSIIFQIIVFILFGIIVHERAMMFD